MRTAQAVEGIAVGVEPGEETPRRRGIEGGSGDQISGFINGE